MVYIIGDVHGLVKNYLKIVQSFNSDDYSLQIGDMGFAETYQTIKYKFDSMGINVGRHIFFPGNHDEYPALHIPPNLLSGESGIIPFVEDSFFIRGAFSIDQKYRTQGISWWPEEEIPYKHFDDVYADYINKKPRIMFSHTCPDFVGHVMGYNMFKSKTGDLLSECFKAHRPEIWIFGHMHQSFDKILGLTRFICLDELEIMELPE